MTILCNVIIMCIIALDDQLTFTFQNLVTGRKSDMVTKISCISYWSSSPTAKFGKVRMNISSNRQEVRNLPSDWNFDRLIASNPLFWFKYLAKSPF